MTPAQLKKIMKTQGWGNTELANLAGCDQATIWRYVNNKRKIPPFFANWLKIYLANGKEGV